jgi:MFS family permease
MSGLIVGAVGAICAILGGTHKILFLRLMGTFMVGAASASGYQARFAAIDLATAGNRSKNLSIVVWGSTVGAVAGPNLMQPAGDFARYLNLPRLVGPYFIATTSLALAAIVIFVFLRPDPYLIANLSADGVTQNKHQTIKSALKHIRQIPQALFAVSAIGIGHLAMVSIMIMTPVHMSHMEVALSIIGLVISVHVLGMYAFSPLIGALSDRLGRVKVIQIGIILLLASAAIAGRTSAMNTLPLGFGLFLLGLGWSCTMIAGSTLLSESVSVEMKPASQGASDLVMNLMGATGGAISGVIIGFFSYGWLCTFTAILVATVGFWSLKIKAGQGL